MHPIIGLSDVADRRRQEPKNYTPRISEMIIELLAAITTRLGVSVMAMSSEFRVLWFNNTAITLLDRRGVRIESGLLTGNHRICSIIERTANDCWKCKKTENIVVIDSENFEGPLFLYAETLINRTAGINPPVAIVWLNDPEVSEVDCSWLASAFRLTTAEQAVVAKLSLGLSPEDISAACGISIATVRTHLQRVYAKTGATNQARLVRLAYSFPHTCWQ